MALADQRPPSTTDSELDVTVSPSAAVELYWATMLDGAGALRLTHPSLEALASRREVMDRLAALWGAEDKSDPTADHDSLPELLVLAERAGALAVTDLAGVIAAAVEAAATPVRPPALASESTVDRAVIVGRLAALAASRARRRAWAAVLHDVALEIGGHWRSTGIEVARRATRARTSQLPWSDATSAVLGWARRDYGGLLPDLLARAARARRPVLVVPSYWSGNGAMFDLSEHLLIAIPAQLGPADSRVRTEPMVRVLKALADPTRLAMLDHLASRPRTVGELAIEFGLAQPTASRHVRILRDAGLVVDGPQAATNVINADGPAIRRFLGGLGALFAADLAGVDDGRGVSPPD
jgi:DNA-binding transcriptional ArsR family regulator